MPVLRTPLPEDTYGHRGEFELGQTLKSLTIPRVELWFNLKFPGVPEIDVILNDPARGAYIGEVKAFHIDEIAEYTMSTFTGADGRSPQHPVKQVERAELALRELLTREGSGYHSVRAPFVQRTVIWPRIRRSDFIAKFQAPLVSTQAMGMLFLDDLESEDNLERALERISDNPLLGGHVPAAVRQEQPGIQTLRNLTIDLGGSKPAKSEAGLSEREITDLIKTTSKPSLRAERYGTGSGHKVAFRGFPGSGKTSALREIGIKHALEGKSVLFLCFNKTLAAKLRLEIQEVMATLSSADYLFIANDGFQFLKTFVPDARVSNVEDMVMPKLAELKQAGQLPEFDTILIDEAQDIHGYLIAAAQLVAAPDASFFIAYGDGQNLYNIDKYNGSHSPELEAFLIEAKTEQFNRNFRSGPTTQLICSAVSDYYPDIDQALDWLIPHINVRNNSNSQGAFDFSEYTYEPVIQIIDTPVNLSNRRYMLETILGLILSAEEANHEFDTLIIVGGTGSPNYDAIRKLLSLMEIPYCDHVNQDNRRSVPRKNEITITNFHNARGLTCRNALIMDIDEMSSRAGVDGRASVNTLLNIALSRATESTYILSGLHDNEYSGHETLMFLSALIETLQDLKQ